MDNEPKTLGPHVALIKKFPNGTMLTLAVLGLNLLLFTANLYLSNGYVSRVQYEADQKDSLQRREQITNDFHEIALQLKGITDQMKIDIQQDEKLKDLEARVRDVERAKR
jgi:small-conductance mechanosensitive channel